MKSLAERQAAMRLGMRMPQPVPKPRLPRVAAGKLERAPKPRERHVNLKPINLSPDQLASGYVSGFMYHLGHLQGGIWAEKSCAVCKMSNPASGWLPQADVAPGAQQKRIA